MNLSEILTVLAILLAPVVAIQVSVYLEKRRTQKNRRLDIFRTLMASRAARLSIHHVNALNSIDVEFYGKDVKFKKVVEALKVYLTHLNDKTLFDASLESWHSKGDDLLVELLQKMAICLNYDFDKDTIKKTSYYPEGYGQQELEGLIIRKGFADIFSGKKPFPIQAFSDKLGKELLDLQIKYFSEYMKKPLEVKVLKEND